VSCKRLTKIIKVIEMAIQVTIIGLGQIGTSIGLALGEREDAFLRVGHDRSPAVAKKAEKIGAVDRVELNLPRSVAKAELILLAIPVDQIRDTLTIIAEDLKPGAVVMDTAPLKEVVGSWAGELIPAERYYVGLTPAINPAYLLETTSGAEAAHPDLFKDGMMVIIAPPRTDSDAIELAADLTRLLGATPLYADPLEIDSLMAATHLLPQLVAAALINSTVDQPGWREARKVAGRPFAHATNPFSYADQPENLQSASMLNQENVLRVMDRMIIALQDLREDIAKNDNTKFQADLEQARARRELWWKQRWAANWAAEEIDASPAEVPKTSDMLGRFIGLGRKKKPKD
jgi:prephenate dehydrogenase